jgi:hypothetical protein
MYLSIPPSTAPREKTRVFHMGDCVCSGNPSAVAQPIACGRERTPVPAVERACVRSDRVLGEEQPLTDLPDGQLALEEPEHGKLGPARRLKALAAGRAVARRLELLCDRVGERGNRSAVAKLAERLPRGAQRRLSIDQTPASRPDTGQEDQQPRAVHGRHLVGEEARRHGELMLGLDQGPLGRQHNAQGGRRAGSKPAAARAGPAHHRLRPLRMASSYLPRINA